jgi:hypothetical protein
VLKCTFIPEKSRGTIYESILKVQLTNEEAKGHIEDHTSNAHLAAELGKPRPLGAAQAVQSELVSLWREVRRFAAEDLDVEHQKRWWRDIGNWFKSFHWPQAKNKTLTG